MHVVPVPSLTYIATLPRRCGMAWWPLKRVLQLLGFAALALPALAQQPQRVETQGSQSPAITASGNVAVTYGLTPEQVQELTRAATTGARGAARR